MAETESYFDILKEIFTFACQKTDIGHVMEKNIQLEKNSLIIKENSISLNSFRKIFVVGAGIAAAPMAYYLENLLKDKLNQGLILVPTGYKENLRNIQTREVTSPLIDAKSYKALQDFLYILEGAQENDLVIMLLSKGASEIIELLYDDISFNDYNSLLKKLKACNATDIEINTMKTHVSKLKGGQLLRYINPATTITLMLSDQPAGNLENTFLAPTYFDPTTFKDCRKILLRHKIPMKLPTNILNHFNQGMQGKIPDTVKPGDPLLSRVENFVIYDCTIFAHDTLKAAEDMKISSTILSTRFHGDPYNMGHFFGSIMKDISEFSIPTTPPCILIGSGRINSSDEYRLRQCATLAMSVANEISGFPNLFFLAASSFQYENEGPVGCIINGDTVPDIKKAGVDPIDIVLQKKELKVLNKMNLLIRSKYQINDCGDLFIMGIF